MESIYESDPYYTTPLMKWGIDVSKMRRKAFASYTKNYQDALIQWPEFKQEFDYRMSMKSEPIPVIKETGVSSFWGRKNFLKSMRLSNTE